MRLFKHPLRESLVLLAPGYCTRELVDENIRALGLDRSVKPAIEMNSIEGVLTTVQQTNMITFLPNAAVQWNTIRTYESCRSPMSKKNFQAAHGSHPDAVLMAHRKRRAGHESGPRS
jgi:DNA-binding transcriptional LysR family regulator